MGNARFLSYAVEPANTSWRLNHREATIIAIRDWGLRWPVVIERRRWKAWHGWHVTEPAAYLDDGSVLYYRHRIRFNGNGTVEYALRTLAHELTHAAQAERLGVSAFRHCYLTDSAGFERIAAESEERWRELLPAVKEVR